DEMNRLKTAGTTATWGNAYVYDRWANLLQKNVTVGTAETLDVTVDLATNHMTNTGFTYNADGSLTGTGNHNFTYDAENRILTINNPTIYAYDGDSLRVKKDDVTASNDCLYWRGCGTDVQAVYDLTSTM